MPPCVPTITDLGLELWPPNHKFHAITPEDCARITTCNGSATVVRFTTITSDEPFEDIGDGNFEPDIVAESCDEVLLRAERMGGENGRVYTLGITAVFGESVVSGTCTVTVPHDMGPFGAAIDDGPVEVVEAPACVE